MSDIDKLILKMKRQPNGIRFQELTKVLEYNGYTMKQKKRNITQKFYCVNNKVPGYPTAIFDCATGRVLINQNGDVITIKEDNPLKAVYVKEVLKRIGE